MLGNSLRSLLRGKGQEEWEVVLPQIMRAYHSTPHSSTLETPNFLMLGIKKGFLSIELTKFLPRRATSTSTWMSSLLT